MIGTLRRNGHSVVITIPPEEMDRIGVRVGDMVHVQIRAVDIRPRLSPRVEAAARKIVARPGTAEALARLANG